VHNPLPRPTRQPARASPVSNDVVTRPLVAEWRSTGPNENAVFDAKIPGTDSGASIGLKNGGGSEWNANTQYELLTHLLVIRSSLIYCFKAIQSNYCLLTRRVAMFFVVSIFVLNLTFSCDARPFWMVIIDAREYSWCLILKSHDYARPKGQLTLYTLLYAIKC
jgi:hypothetical protein